MKLPRFCFGLVLLLSHFLIVQSSGQTTPPIRIMPMGDSITFGSGGTANLGGYRGPLYTLLAGQGYNVDFVGTQTGNSASVPDPDHQGHGGWRIDQLDANVAGWFGSIADPDVVLLHIGTNDFGQNFNTATAIDRLDALILKMVTLRPHTHIIVTNLMERDATRDALIQTEFNPFVQSRVAAHAALGRRVTFLDMRAAVPLSDMPDQLHPNQTGYQKMAEAWLPAIQAVVGINGDALPPQIARARGAADVTHVTITYSKPVADSAADLAKYSISGGLTITQANLSADKRAVTLTTSPQARGTLYTVTVNGVSDRITPTPNTIATNSSADFFAATLRGYLNHIPEAVGYTLVHTLDVPAAVNSQANGISYSLDNRNGIGTFDRVAYYVELQAGDGDLQYVWTSMDAFTTDVNKIGVPTVASEAIFQQEVSAMNVLSNAPGIVTGTGLTGNIEFWPTNYSAGNANGISGASDSLYDFGDARTPSGSYGSMQVHNAAAGQTLFAFNNWGGTGASNVDLGIGNSPAPVDNGLDWTFARNGGNYTVRRIQVLVRTTGDATAPTLVSATSYFGGNSIRVTFSEPVLAPTVQASNFTLNGGVTVLGATLAANQRDVVLVTTAQPAGTLLTLTVSGVRDTSPSANRIAAGSTVPVSAAVLPPEIQNRVGAAAAGYQLAQSLEIPVVGNLNALAEAAYLTDDRLATGTFSRVAYYLELQRPGQEPQFVWTAMDAFTANRGRLGVPTLASGAVFQRPVSNLDVLSNVPGVVTGTAMTGGNIEFWPQDYNQGNAANVPNASATAYDFGDTRVSSGGNNFGSMQVHNSGASQTVLAINHFGTDGNTLDLGIGTQATGNPDWTFAANAAAFSRRILHVLVLPGSTAPASITSKVPEAAGYQLAATVNIPAAGNLNNANVYALDQRAEVGPFSRIAYYLELKRPEDTEPQYIWTSMDAYTTDPAKIGVPTSASGAVFQQLVTRLNVFSNVPGVVTGTGIETGNIEFWPTDYSNPNGANIPGASSTLFDFGDTRSGTGSHGSMQLHNYGAAQTLFSITNWGNGGSTTNVFGLGIGNRSTSNPDWTFAANSNTYESRVLHVYVLPGNSDATGPGFLRTAPSTTLNRLVVTFNEPVADTAAAIANFAIDGGVTITSATLLPSKRDVLLTTTAQTAGTVYTLTGSGIRDRSPAGNVIAAGASIAFTAYTPPAILANVPETAGYELIYQLAIPSTVPRWNFNVIPYGINEAQYGERGFDRVAYLMELDGNWVYVSFDPFTNSVSKIGVPTMSVSTTPIQRLVTQMNVASNVPGITTGTGIATGNIEFWGGNYSAPNALGIPNASATAFDFGDTMGAGGHGSMQVHNHGASQVLFAYNNWGSNASGTSDLGIGSRPTSEPDWTFSNSASTYTTRNLYVLVRPAPFTPTGPAPQLLSHPTSRGVQNGGSTTLSVQVTGTGPFTYQWRRNGVAITGETNPWLDLTGFDDDLAGTYDVVVTGPNGVSTISEPAVLTVVNANPLFAGFSFTINRDELASIPRAALLGKATDADGDTLTITGSATASQQGGTVSLQATAINFTPAAGFLGADSFTVTISDGQGGSVIGTVNATVTAAAVNPAGQSTISGRNDGKVDLLFKATAGQTYRVQRSTDLIEWTTIATLPAGDDGLLPFTDPNPPDDNAFYRTITP